MSPLLRKETRLLLPTWIAALVAATAPLWLWHEAEGLVPVLFGVAVLAMVLSPFGLETSYGTFGLLLVQPADRRRFWRIKTGLLAAALVSACMLFLLCLPSSQIADRAEISDVLKWSVVLTLLAFSGGLWTTLLLRDTVSAFFCTLMAPLLITGAILLPLTHWVDKDKILENVVCWVLAVYGVAGFFLARRLFLRAQDVGWTGGQISLTSVRGMSLRWLAFEFKGPQNPWTALIKKELQLQEITMFLIPALVLLHLAALTAYHFAPQRMSQELCHIAIPMIWLFTVPFVIGCVTVAEERRLNTLEGLLCLPVTKRGQFAVKLSVALVLGIVLGGIIPWILLRIGGMTKDFELRYVVGISAAVTAIAFYGSTMSRGLLQALPTTVCIPMLAGMAMALIGKFADATNHNLWFVNNSLLPAMAWPALILTFIWLSFNNYKRLQIGWRVWLGDFARAGAVFGCVTLGFFAIFDRSWELILPLEPSHGPTRIIGAGRASMAASWDHVLVLLPDGRLWVGKSIWTGKRNRRKLTRISGVFANGSNWVKIAITGSGAAAIQSDGTLWKIPNGSDIRQIGSDSDWKEVAAGGGTFMAVKQDGTLWGWGFDGYGMITENPIRVKGAATVAAPVRIGNDSDWVNVFIPSGEHAVGIKRDGKAWQWGDIRAKKNGSTTVHPIRQMVRLDMEGSDWLALSRVWELTLAIRPDGSLWASGTLPPKIFDQDVRMSSTSLTARVGTKSDWVSLSGDWQQTALEANGTVSTMQYNGNVQSKRPSKYSDWLAATEYGEMTWALAKDGTLSCWNEFGINWPDDKATFMQRFFLGPTRRPLISHNILGQQ